jgi:kynurenine formamidase
MSDVAQNRDARIAFLDRLRTLRQWSRWGDDDQKGAVNLLTPDLIRSAASLVRLGEVYSMARPWAVTPGPDNLEPAQLSVEMRPAARALGDEISIRPHGRATTHLDALCHVWSDDGMWNGRVPEQEFAPNGARWCGIDQWRNGIVARGVLLDIAAARPAGYVEQGDPVTATELRGFIRDTNIELRPGDALIVHSGREAWSRAHGYPWGSELPDREYERPGLADSCLEFLSEADPSLLIWDMMDAVPSDCGVRYPVHAAIHTLGLPFLDNALLEPVAQRCRETGRTDFMVTVAPLVIVGGTGSPVNPLATL